MYSINFTVAKKKFCFKKKRKFALQWSKQLFICEWYKIYKVKAKDFEIVASVLCLGNISKELSADNMKKTEFNGYIFDFSVDYNVADVDDIVDIHKYLMKKRITQCK